MNNLLHFQSILVALVIGLPLVLSLNIKAPLYQGFVVFVIYLLLSKCFSIVDNQIKVADESVKIESENESDIESENEDEGVLKYPVNDGSIMPENELHKVDEPKSLANLEVSNSGPLDNLKPDELLNKLNYIHYATSHPYQPMNYQKYKSTSDHQLENDKNTEGPIGATNSVKHLESANYFYPDLTKNQINYDDCTNHAPNSSLSCNQGPNNQNLFPTQEQSILVAGLKDENDLKIIAREDFSVPAPVLNNDSDVKPLFKNAPNKKNGNLCRHCKVGTCKHSICGSA